MKGLAAEYEALRRHAVVIDRSDRGRVRFMGAKAADALNGLITNDVASLHPGRGAYAAALTPKGKIVSDLRVFVDADSILVDSPAHPQAWEGWWGIVQKYVNPRMSSYRDERETTGDLGVFGPQSRKVVGALTGLSDDALDRLENFDHVRVDTVAGVGSVVIARVPDLGVEGYDLFGLRPAMDELRDRATASGGGAVLLGSEALEIARVESGRPAWGIDIDDSTIPQEANLDELSAISYTKGCYTGQEVVARVHFRGHVNRRLRGLRASSAEPPQSGAVLMDAEGKQVGDVRSAVSSPRLGGIALGMVRREVEPGTELTAKWSDGERKVHVVSLPFIG